MQQRYLEGRIHFGAQSFDRNFDDVGVAVEIHIPNLLGNLGSRQHLTLFPEKQRKQQELLGAQIEAQTIPENLAAGQVHFKIV